MNCSRRRWLAKTGGLAVSSALSQAVASAQSAGSAGRAKLSMPGLFRGKVVAVEHSHSISNGVYQPETVQTMMRKGMASLTGAPEWQAAWKVFFEPGDVVGIKLNPVGRPHIMSDPAVLHEVVAGLEAAGIKRKDIVAYDRYRTEFLAAKMDKWLPEGVRYMNAAEGWEAIQQDIKGYDPDQYIDIALTMPGYDVRNDVARRSHAALFISKHVNKLVTIPVLKEHQSAGITFALKNLSHGLVNNVNRTHSTSFLNACGSFIPAAVSLPVIRDKAVLHIGDGIKAQYHGGPSGKPQFIWEHATLYFATDPVALDRVGWQVLDTQRASVGKKPLAEDGPDKFDTFVRRQPEHVDIAGAMGLGEADLKKIQLQKVRLG